MIYKHLGLLSIEQEAELKAIGKKYILSSAVEAVTQNSGILMKFLS